MNLFYFCARCFLFLVFYVGLIFLWCLRFRCRHLEKESELLSNAHKAMSDELHRLQVYNLSLYSCLTILFSSACIPSRTTFLAFLSVMNLLNPLPLWTQILFILIGNWLCMYLRITKQYYKSYSNFDSSRIFTINSCAEKKLFKSWVWAQTLNMFSSNSGITSQYHTQISGNLGRKTSHHAFTVIG